MNPTSRIGATKMKTNKGVTFYFDLCSQCKSVCCQDARPPLSQNRMKVLKKYLEKQGIAARKLFVTENYSYPAVDKQLFCCLFDKQTGKCSVHKVKPETCVSGPITFDINFKTGKVEWFLKKESICAYAGVLFSDKAALAAHLDVAKKELTQLIGELDADELKTIVKIEEPQTFKIGEDELTSETTSKLGCAKGIPRREA